MAIKAGDKVHWTYILRKGKVIEMTRKEGTVLSVSGDIAKIRVHGKPQGGRFASKLISKLSLVGQPGEIDFAVRAIRQDATGSPEGPRTWPEGGADGARDD